MPGTHFETEILRNNIMLSPENIIHDVLTVLDLLEVTKDQLSRLYIIELRLMLLE